MSESNKDVDVRRILRPLTQLIDRSVSCAGVVTIDKAALVVAMEDVSLELAVLVAPDDETRYENLKFLANNLAEQLDEIQQICIDADIEEGSVRTKVEAVRELARRTTPDFHLHLPIVETLNRIITQQNEERQRIIAENERNYNELLARLAVQDQQIEKLREALRRAVKYVQADNDFTTADWDDYREMMELVKTVASRPALDSGKVTPGAKGWSIWADDQLPVRCANNRSPHRFGPGCSGDIEVVTDESPAPTEKDVACTEYIPSDPRAPIHGKCKTCHLPWQSHSKAALDAFAAPSKKGSVDVMHTVFNCVACGTAKCMLVDR